MEPESVAAPVTAALGDGDDAVTLDFVVL